MKTRKPTTIVIAAGGTGGHIFPALSVALQMRKARDDCSQLWIGTKRSREMELCGRYGIPIAILSVSGIERKVTVKTILAVLLFMWAFFRVLLFFVKRRPSAIIAFGGYVCAPVLAAACCLRVPYFIHEQNTVIGMVNRFFAPAATRLFAGLPLFGGKKLNSTIEVVGTPVRPGNRADFEHFAYPSGFDRAKSTVLICGGSQGAQSMNERLVGSVQSWAGKGIQVVWQTGEPGYKDVMSRVGSLRGIFVFSTIDDLYPFYAVASVVVGRAGASTLAEIAFFGLPCVLIPLPWATENHQWINAGVVETQGWGVRVQQDDQCGIEVDKSVMNIITNKRLHEAMSAKARSNSPRQAAQTIVQRILDTVRQ